MADITSVAAPADTGRRAVGAGTTVLVVAFTATAFLGAGLLFVVQPMVARLVLPAYGGSATVWSTSSLFFQVLLLLGYLYTHLSTRHLGRRWQPPLHLVLLLLPLLVLPLSIPDDAVPPPGTSPVAWLLRVLTVTIGLPFFVVSTTGPLVQRWYSWTGGPRADDPYFIFAASNLGSFGGLLAYPFLIEPNLTLAQQRSWWSWAFVGFAALTGACGVATWLRSRGAAVPREAEVPGRTAHPSPTLEPLALGRRRVARWTVLAFLPSAMMLAVTSHISTDIAAIPLLWVVPLAIYLATFVAAFARRSRVVPRGVVRLAVGATFAALVASLLTFRVPTWLDIALNLTMLALVSYAAHARLAAERPPVRQLTAYYLVISVGGALGGLLNGLIAPLVFDRVLEYALVAVLVPLVLVSRSSGRRGGVVPAATPAEAPAVAPAEAPAVAPAVAPAEQPQAPVPGPGSPRNWVRLVNGALAAVVVCGLAVFLLLRLPPDGRALSLLAIGFAFLFGWRVGTRRLEATGVLAVVVIAVLVLSTPGTIERSRTFYGSYRVSEAGELHQLSHGTTLHGSQFTDERRTEPTTYYARSGPLGAVFSLERFHDVAVVGLGAGTIAAYGEPGERMTFVEIDPEVARIARDPHLFTYLRDSRAAIDVRIGDGRLVMGQVPEHSLDLIVLDAFSSDSIPVHLLTREAMELYASRLAPGGLIAVHISNRVFDLRPVVAAGADALGLTAVLGQGGAGDDGATATAWVVLGDPTTTNALLAKPGWSRIDVAPVVWTDDYSSILSVLR